MCRFRLQVWNQDYEWIDHTIVNAKENLSTERAFLGENFTYINESFQFYFAETLVFKYGIEFSNISF